MYDGFGLLRFSGLHLAMLLVLIQGCDNGGGSGNNPVDASCKTAAAGTYPQQSTSPYVLPYSIGESYYRGLNQSLRILANLEPTGGVTLHFVEPGADTGSIIAQERIALPPDANFTYYKEKVAEGAARILRDSWPRLQAGTSGTPQSHTDQPVVIIDEPTSRVLRWLNKQRRSFGLPLRNI